MLTLANTAEEWEVISAAEDTCFVRSKDDWERLLSHGESHNAAVDMSLIGKIPDTALTDFTQSLIFSKNTLGHADYSMLRPHLSMEEIVSLFAAFGMSRKYFSDYSDHYCDTGASTCYHRTDAICTSTC